MTRHPLSQHRGAIAPLSAVLMVGLLGMAAFAIDCGYIVHVHTELQRTADASALAAANRLPDADAAVAAAQAYVTHNLGTNGTSLSPTVDFGYWDRDTAQLIQPPPTGRQINAARVSLERSAAQGNPLKLFFGGILGVEQATARASAIAMYDHSLCGPFVGIEWIKMPGGPMTDSYNSLDGTYASQVPGDRGSLCSDGWINVEGAATVNGNAQSGKGQDVGIYGGAIVTGSIGERKKPLNLDPVDASRVANANDNDTLPLVKKGNSWVSLVDGNGNFLLDGSTTYDMPPGTYYFNDFTLEGQSILNFSGPTTIYLTGDMNRSGGVTVNNNTKIPSNLQILMTGGVANVTSSNPFHGLIYAPNTAVTVDGAADFYGAVVGRTLTATGSGTGHFDESLETAGVAFPRRTTLVD